MKVSPVPMGICLASRPVCELLSSLLIVDWFLFHQVGLTNHPIITKTIINVVIYLIGDWMSQVGFARAVEVVWLDLNVCVCVPIDDGR